MEVHRKHAEERKAAEDVEGLDALAGGGGVEGLRRRVGRSRVGRHGLGAAGKL
jgi:hypothetical protein